MQINVLQLLMFARSVSKHSINSTEQMDYESTFRMCERAKESAFTKIAPPPIGQSTDQTCFDNQRMLTNFFYGMCITIANIGEHLLPSDSVPRRSLITFCELLGIFYHPTPSVRLGV
jgi:hypothetical protein